jgi:hypothetical protein
MWNRAISKPHFIEWREPIPNDIHEVNSRIFAVEKVTKNDGEVIYAYPEFDVVVRVNGQIGVLAKKIFEENYEVIE